MDEVLRARDAEGRNRQENTRTLNGDVIRNITIFDYPTQTRYTWTVGPNSPSVVTVYRPRPAVQQSIPTQAVHRYYPYRSESLPPQTIDGVYVEGQRSTRTIPAGYEGNDHDLITTTESWSAPDLGMLIRQVTDDPRAGKSTTETTDIQRSADPAHFQPPPGYELKNANP